MTNIKSFEVIHTITSPYRIHMFNIMNEILMSKGIKFHVNFMSDVTSHRPADWSASSQSIHFSHDFWNDKGPKLFGNKWHFNPGILKHILKTKIDYLLIGGPWASITTLTSSFIAKSKTRKIAWIEGNANTITAKQLRSVYIKRMVLNKFDFCAVPGMRAIEYVNRITNNSYPANHILKLPNIINEEMFDLTEKSSQVNIVEIANQNNINLSPSIKTALIPARLIPEKGLLEFFAHIDTSQLTNWQIIIAGKGPLKNKILSLISNRNLNNHVKIIDPINYLDMPILYKLSDLFIIPSVKDNNPLTLIEALHSKLPILASNKIGNYPEAIQDGINGWSLNPLDAKSIQLASSSAFSSSKQKLQLMGVKSKDIANKNWNSKEALETFLNTAI